MKITIAYTPGEEREADIIKAFAKGLLGRVKERKSDRHAPFMHIYITTGKPENPCGSKENA